MENLALELFNRNKRIAKQCVNCNNLTPCKTDGWPLVTADNINCDNFIKRGWFDSQEEWA